MTDKKQSISYANSCKKMTTTLSFSKCIKILIRSREAFFIYLRSQPSSFLLPCCHWPIENSFSRVLTLSLHRALGGRSMNLLSKPKLMRVTRYTGDVTHTIEFHAKAQYTLS